LASESGTGCFMAGKTGLFGAVWREDRMESQVNYRKGGKRAWIGDMNFGFDF